MTNLTTEEFIQTIKKRPQMFVGSETVSELHGLLRGYLYARSTLLQLDEYESEILKDFSLWLINEKLDIVRGDSLSWNNVLLLYYTSQKTAFDKFFELWDEFILSKQHNN